MLKPKWEKWAAVLAVVLMLVGTGLYAGQNASTAPGTVIALDVNPSLEIEINQMDEITAVRALNGEARIVVGETDLVGMRLEEGVTALIESMLRNGYLSAEQNSILVSVDAANILKSKRLKGRLSNEIDSLLRSRHLNASIITQDFDRTEYGSDTGAATALSPARATLITRIVEAELTDANGVPYTYGELAELKVNELKLILDARAVKVEGIQCLGTASGEKYITAEEALSVALGKAELTKDGITQLKVDWDYDHDCSDADGRTGTMVYEIEFRVGNTKYEYEIHAESAQILYEEVKEKNDRPSSTPADTVESGDETSSPEETLMDETLIHETLIHETLIGRPEALAIAYADAGVETADVKRPEMEFLRVDGTPVYEIAFKSRGTAYAYTVNAVTGEIIYREAD